VPEAKEKVDRAGLSGVEVGGRETLGGGPTLRGGGATSANVCSR